MKHKILSSKPLALIILILVIIMLITRFSPVNAWWAYIDIFFFFMMAFDHLVALLLRSHNAISARQLDKVALVCGILGIVAFIGEWVALNIMM